MAAGLSLTLYRAGILALSPLFPALLRARARRGKENPSRLGERMGRASRPRPAGILVWIHGASVGEVLSALPLAARWIAAGKKVLITSGTVTSATLLQTRLPEDLIHQFVPLDAPAAVLRFLDHWRPDAAIFIESELWPNLVLAAETRHIPMMLANARMSERSFRGWRRFPSLARAVVGAFDLCLAQDQEMAARLIALGARDVRIAGSLKADAAPLPADAVAFAALRKAIGTRPVFLAASTHRGEEETVLAADARLRARHPDLLTIIAPRHPERGPEVHALAEAKRLTTMRRSAHALPYGGTDVYIADTLGELGLLFRCATFVVLGGSFVAKGGHNPLEPAKLGVATIAGPHTENFARDYEVVLTAQGMGRLQTAEDLAALAGRFLSDPDLARAAGATAKDAVGTLGGALDACDDALERLLQLHARA